MWTFSEFMVALVDKLSSCWINKKGLDKGIRYEARSVLCDLCVYCLLTGWRTGAESKLSSPPGLFTGQCT